MLIKDIQSELNKELEQFIGQKIAVGDFHEDLKIITRRVLRRLGINILEYGMWNINIKVKGNIKTLFNIQLGLIDDKRCVWERKGKITYVYCTIEGGERYENIELDDFLAVKKKEELVKKIGDAEKSIELKYKEIEELKQKKVIWEYQLKEDK
jgi:uncharacterized protein YjhX (UPF0386 family)